MECMSGVWSLRQIDVSGPVQETDITDLISLFYLNLLRQGEKVLMNKAVGHLLRTRSSQLREGGISTGSAVVDSPLLI